VRGVDYEIYDSKADALDGGTPSTSIDECSGTFIDGIGFPGDCIGGYEYTSAQGEGCLEESDYYALGQNVDIFVLNLYMTTDIALAYESSSGIDYTSVNGDL
jgi:hypothetical protein